MWKEVIVSVFLIINTIMDLKTRKINIILCVLYGGLGIIVSVLCQDKDWISLAGGMAVGAYLLFFALLTREAIGIGDGFLVTAVGIWIGGSRTLLILMGSFLLTAVSGLIGICTGKVTGKSELAFVPFFTLSYAIIFAGGLL